MYAAVTLAVVCALLQPVQPEAEACPELCECSSRPEPIAKRRAKAVTCSGTGESQLPASLAASVEVLRFTNNSLRRIDFYTLRRLPALLALELSCNGVHEVLGSGRAVPRLRHLDLSVNNLHIIQPHAFRDLPELVFLNLSWNGLHTISPAAFTLPGLLQLDLRHNRLAVLRAHYFSAAPALRLLQLAHNAIASVPALVFTRSFHSLQLAHNRIVRVAETAFEGINITGTLDLSANSLRRTPSAALKRLGRVDTLLLDDNQLRVVPSSAIAGMAARVVSISAQKHLRFIQRGAFLNLPELERLELRDNPSLSYLPPGAIALVPRLTALNLSGNSLLALEREFITAMPTVEHLDVSNNSFVCHCSLRWLQGEPTRAVGVQCVSQLRTQLVELSTMPETCAPFVLPLFPDTVSAELGSNASFQCRALAVPAAKLTWASPGGTLRLGNNACSGRLCVRDHALTVRFLHREDAGEYTCLARNSLGSSSRLVVLQVTDPNVKLFPLTVASTFVTLAWNMSVVTSHSYVLRWSSSTERPARSAPFTAGPRTHSYTVHGLQPGVQYAFSLRMERDQDSIELCHLILTTQQHGYLLSLGIERNYLGAIMLSAGLGSVAVGCALYCGVKCYRRAKEGFSPERTSTLRKAELFQSTSAHSDVAFITFIELPEEVTDLTESHLA